MEATQTTRWLRLVDSFGLKKPGSNPWDATRLDDAYAGASHGEKCTIRFLLNLWNSAEQWNCGSFDFFDAFATWGEGQRKAFLAWASDPWWP